MKNLNLNEGKQIKNGGLKIGGNQMNNWNCKYKGINNLEKDIIEQYKGQKNKLKRIKVDIV